MAAARKGRKISLSEVEQPGLKDTWGYLRAMIVNNKLYIIEENGNLNTRRLATLHSLNLALSTSLFKIRDIEFTLSVFDSVKPDFLTWAFARQKQFTNATWVMPDFGLWSWPEPKVGSFGEVLMRANEMEEAYPTLQSKDPRLVWRGGALGLPIRKAFLDLTAKKPWSDVMEINWGSKEDLKEHLLTMADHCRYKFLAHVEGHSYSGRLKYLQACNSVIVAHKLNWVQHHHPMMISSGPKQNFVEVEMDFSNLEATIQDLLANPAKAERIAFTSQQTWRKYLSLAATNCYWRRLFIVWGSLLDFEPQFYKSQQNGVSIGRKEWRDVPWESYALLEKLEWDPM